MTTARRVRALLALLALNAACTAASETSDSGSATTEVVRPDSATSTTGSTTDSTTSASVAEPTTTASIATSETTSTSAVPSTTVVSLPLSTTTPYVVPVAQADAAGWSNTHSAYPATDIFVPGGCGDEIVSPVDGVTLEVRRVDGWDPAVDHPATRGGRSVAVLGDDGVRYYLAHFDTIEDDIEPGVRVLAGDVLGTIGVTGRTSACHVHFGISPPCPEVEWSIRRGVIWPFPYLDAWLAGEQLSPLAEVADWSEANPDACTAAAADVP